MGHAGRFKRGSYHWAMGRLTRAADARVAGRRGASLGAWLGRHLVAGAVKRQAGLGRVRYAGIGGSFVANDSLRWFWALGVPVREQYGQVETGGIVTTQRGESDLGTAGLPIDPSIGLRLEGEEIQVRGPGLAVGTLDGSGVTDAEGWFATGDLARIDADGRVVPVGRQAHVLTTASGQVISPAEIESALKASPYVRSAMIVAADRPFVGALVELDEEAAGDWARQRGISVSTYVALAANEQVYELVAEEVTGRKRRAPDRASRTGVPDPLAAPRGRAHADRQDPAGDGRAAVRGADRRDVRRASADQARDRSRRCVSRDLTLPVTPPS